MSHSQKSAEKYAMIVDRFMLDYLATVPTQIKVESLENRVKVVKDAPKQRNGSDCGLCVCLNM